MSNKTGKLVVSDIKKTLFVIPYYQRGYRWTANNVKQLLSDLFIFAQNEESEYCLQPIVLQRISDSEYTGVLNGEESVIRVVDGQQRLTTIAIVLYKLGIETTWDIYYNTEKKRLSEILPEILKEHPNLISINDYFRKEVSDAIDEWLLKKKENKPDDFLKSVFQSKEEKKIAFLEYAIGTSGEVNSEKEGHNAFLRLNDGKTPLTSSELVKAKYMVNGNGLTDQQKMEISKEWELIEDSLQNDRFWLMFNAKGLEDTPTRIDLLFTLVLGVDLELVKANFRIVFETLEDEEKKYDLEKVWDEVLNIFWWMQSCYYDVELCNYLCWIRKYTDNAASTIYSYRRQYPAHSDFKKCIIGVIQKVFADRQIRTLDSVEYYTWSIDDLRKLFVLLNIIDCNKSKERFCFDLFNQEEWDIEHIDSQTPNDLKRDKDKREWLESSYKELSHEQRALFVKDLKLAENVESFEVENVGLDNFESYAEKIVQLVRGEYDKIPDENLNKIGNLALLNRSINRSYKNSIFPRKRKTIIETVSKAEKFIPPCTVKTFMKFYTTSPSKITYWQNADYEGYASAMNRMFTEFMDEDTQVGEPEKNDLTLTRSSETLSELQKISTPDEKKHRVDDSICFNKFMDKYDVVIPRIQRLYVQGRLDKRGQKCLSGFASSLVDSISESTPLLLDFVYGIDDESGSKPTFYPLDGQQRLTTLLLLAWLCGLSKPNWTFRYEARRATEIFIKKLLEDTPPKLEKKPEYDKRKREAKEQKKDYPPLCREYIRSRPWFHDAWLFDTGISGMLEMLDSLYDKLLNRQNKVSQNMDSITFLLNYLDASIKSYDQIYFKMNSRGRELTEWDNVHAVLDEFLPHDFKNSWPDKIQKWYELMWCKITSKSAQDTATNTAQINEVDAKMLSVIELALDCSGYSDKYKSTNTYQLSKWLHDQDKSEEVSKFYRLCMIFFSALELKEENSYPYLIPKWTNSPIIPDFTCKIDEIVQNFYQPLLFYYAAKLSKNADWIRVIWNLVVNIDVDSSSFKQAIKLIDGLSQGKESILSFLSKLKLSDIKYSYVATNPQLQEEIDKAKQIIDAKDIRPDDWDSSKGGEWNGWYDIIVKAESQRYFKGAIRFLFRSGNGIDWSTFCTKWWHAEEYFGDDGIKEKWAARFVSALLKRCNKWEQIEERYIFDRTELKYSVLLEPLYAEPLDYILRSDTLDVEIVDFEEGKTSERLIRNQLYEEEFIKQAISEYSSYRLSGRKWFYGYRRRDGILFDWEGENRRNAQIQEMIGEISVSNTPVTNKIYDGYIIKFKYKEQSYEWNHSNVIYLNGEELLKVTPDMSGWEILDKLNQPNNRHN